MNRALVLLVVALSMGCEKVPFVDINASFGLSDVTWFEAEQTMFVFYQVDAEQGLSDLSQVELTYRTDDVFVDWTPLKALTPVHPHVPVDCGPTSACGSMSLKVEKVPREVGVRLRYHRDGDLTLGSSVTFNIVGLGPAYPNRSLVVYGVFDETNAHVQWRARHQFPTLRNQQVEGLGLRRYFRVEHPRYGEEGPFAENPYGYGFSTGCSVSTTDLGWGPVDTTDRAIFDTHELPLAASTSGVVCAESTVVDALGTFTAPALAQKNPEVHAAFPSLRSPIAPNSQLGFVLRPCNREISTPQFSMQVQRLLLAGAQEVCIDDWAAPGFASQLAAKFRARFDQERLLGKDMVLTIALHHDELTGVLQDKVEQALELVLPSERDKSSPRVSGAFLFDSYGYVAKRPVLRNLVLWCPANVPLTDLDLVSATSQQSCPLQPDLPDLVLGPFKFANLPILPTRDQYLTFIGKYSEAQAGTMKSITVLAPERTPVSINMPLGDFGTATFFNNETLTAVPTDRFSFCPEGDPKAGNVVFRVTGIDQPIPLSSLPQVQQQFPQPQYFLGLAWDFPFLVRAEYESMVAGAATAFTFTVPFGISSQSQAYYGTQLWQTAEVSLADVLLQCTRFCDHPTFDSAGVYNVTAPWDVTYASQCYRPLFPVLGDGGFPIDP